MIEDAAQWGSGIRVRLADLHWTDVCLLTAGRSNSVSVSALSIPFSVRKGLYLVGYDLFF